MRGFSTCLVVLSLVFAGCGDDEAGGGPVGPRITTQPADVTAYVGDWVVFTVEADGRDLEYRWEVSLDDGATWYALTGEERDYFLIDGAALGDDGLRFRCIVSGADGVVVSDAALLDVLKIVYVDATRPAGGDGRTWATAYTDLQDALVFASSGWEIWVAAGTYKPADTADRTVSFVMKPGVDIYGGFADDEATREERDWSANVTTLSGDIGTAADASDNSYHVVTGADDARLDGFTITGGNGNGSGPADRGGGMYNDSASPTVANCIFRANAALLNGGGVYVEGSSPTFTNCTFDSNTASAGSGGGMYSLTSTCEITDCTFDSNSAGYDGGGMYNDSSSPTVTNCSFSSNSAASYQGGGMCNTNTSSPTVTNCAFSSNSAGDEGGGMYNRSSGPIVTNCTFTSNSANDLGGGMQNNNSSSTTITNSTFSLNSANYGGGMRNWSSNLTMTNCILWGNSATISGNEIYNQNTSAPIVSSSCVEGGLPAGCLDAGGNIGADLVNDDPLFAGAPGDLRLQLGSGCIDTGDDTALPADAADLDGDLDTTEPVPLDLDGNPRVSGSFVDMGTYEYQQ
ncbi:MAG: hypothetical protein ACYTKD_18090 [Planctomycetota bacterium]|jgi:hypothetical protein